LCSKRAIQCGGFCGVNANRAEASTNGAKHKFGSHAELVRELRQFFSPAVLRDSFVVGFLPYFFPIKK
jgi:hypothetical protein